MAACPESHAEIAELGGVVPALFEVVEQVEAPAGLKDRILAAAAAEQAAGAGQGTFTMQRPAAMEPLRAGARASAPRRTVAPEPVADTQRRGWDLGAILRRPIWAAAAAAAVIAAIALGALNLQLRTEIDGLTAYRDGVVEVLEGAARPGAQLAVLTAPEDGPGPTGLAAVGADGSVAMVMRDLAPTTGTQVYEAWLIGSDGTPVPVGSFRVDESRTASFSTARATLGPGVTVALSLEPRAGATTPTVVVAAGTASARES
jgi:anti-sigma-K factor RskA